MAHGRSLIVSASELPQPGRPDNSNVRPAVMTGDHKVAAPMRSGLAQSLVLSLSCVFFAKSPTSWRSGNLLVNSNFCPSRRAPGTISSELFVPLRSSRAATVTASDTSCHKSRPDRAGVRGPIWSTHYAKGGVSFYANGYDTPVGRRGSPVGSYEPAAKGLRMVTPRQVKPSCMSSERSRRHPAWAATASMTASQRAN